MYENQKNKVVIDRLAENLLRYVTPNLRMLLQEYIAKFRRDLLFEEKEFDEEIYIAFPEFGKDLKIVPVSYEVGTNLSFAFLFSGTYEQLQPCEYTYKLSDDKRYLIDFLNGVIAVDECRKNDGTPYILVTLIKPYRSRDFELQQVEVGVGNKQPEILGGGHFEVPLNVTFIPENGSFRFDSLYLSNPEGKREDYLTDAYNRPICLMALDTVFRAEPSKSEAVVADPYGKLPDKSLGVVPGKEILKISVGDSEIPESIIISRSVLARRLLGSLEEKLCRLEDLDENIAENTAKTPEERAKDILSDFAVYQYEMACFEDNRSEHQKELNKARYNLLLKANDMEHALEFVDVLRKNVFPPIKEREYISFKEDELWDNFGNMEQAFEEKKLIVIYDCKEKPVLNTDEMGNGNAMENVKRVIRNHELLWNEIVELATRPAAPRLIVIANDIVYRRTFRFNQKIYDMVCGSHLWLKDLTVDDMCQLFLEELKKSSFGKMLDDDFEIL